MYIDIFDTKAVQIMFAHPTSDPYYPILRADPAQIFLLKWVLCRKKEANNMIICKLIIFKLIFMLQIIFKQYGEAHVYLLK